MAALAVAPKFAIVFIVGRVTAITILRRLHRFGRRVMAIGTSQFCVRAGQRKLRLFAVIERPALPALTVVAGIAAAAERASMFVGGSMTGDTFFRCTFKCCADMAGIAGHHGVQAGQRKESFVVIKRQLFFPTGFVVAVFAMLALLAFVHVVEPVAAGAIFRQCVVHVAAVTGTTLGLAMFAAQCKFGVAIVIEFLFRPGIFVVAAIAALAILALMGVVVAVAGNAFGF